MTIAAMTTVCKTIESGTLYHFLLPILIVGFTTSTNKSRGTALLLLISR